MPGSRLTYQDRERIAEWLAEGLGYAQIARKLNRPTSTISREVARNLGTDGYRADRAQAATGERARRERTPRPIPPRVEDPVATYGFLAEFIELFVVMGSPRMAARVLGCLYVTDSGSLTVAELVRMLHVSPASISQAVSYLEGIKLVRRERDARRERYLVDDAVWWRTWEENLRTSQKWAEIALAGAQEFGPDTPTGIRLDKMGQFLTNVTREMAETGARWRHILMPELSAQHPQPSVARRGSEGESHSARV